MRDVLDDDLAELYPVRPADDVRLARLREQLFAEKPQPRSWRWVGVAAAAMAVVLITGLVVLLRPVSRDAPATMPTAAATSLPEAAAVLELAPKPTTKYRHIKYQVWQLVTDGEAPFDATSVKFEYDVWLPTAPNEMVLIYRRFTGEHRAVTGPQRPIKDIEGRTSGTILWNSFCAATPCQEESISKPLPVNDGEKLEAAAQALLSPFTTTGEKAGLYRRLAEGPAIRWDNGKVFTEGSRWVFRVDPVTGEVTGMDVDAPHDTRLPSGTLALSVTVTYEWTDQRPS
ncbi:hypothetical protein SAMN04488564_101590 [Lentzea waywayandensis]|uniref:Uncharacterized protein n=1 Tax=Lentzea waywayandensis TaxID=84724 RepID=A0A1I6CYR6_9PSEU|nr:hypothetical protein [Lentzea waywayandensis]SFQ98240.1 hypothetical protein SAMN04488564_101590 [Lentzea waywayandensis]